MRGRWRTAGICAKLSVGRGHTAGRTVPDLRQLRDQVNSAHRAYHTLHDALTALPGDHPAHQRLAELVAVAAKHWHEARLTLDAARDNAADTPTNGAVRS